MGVAIITLAEARAHLRYPPGNTEDDQAIEGFISAAEDVVQTECGDIIPHEYDENQNGGNRSLYTYHKPILAVSNVEEGWGWVNYELDYVQVNSPAGSVQSMYAYSIDDSDAGLITRRSAGNIAIPFFPGVDNIRVIYTAGRQEVPGAIRLFCLELVAYWWQGSQQRRSGAQAISSTYGFAMADERVTSGAQG